MTHEQSKRSNVAGWLQTAVAEPIWWKSNFYSQFATFSLDSPLPSMREVQLVLARGQGNQGDLLRRLIENLGADALILVVDPECPESPNDLTKWKLCNVVNLDPADDAGSTASFLHTLNMVLHSGLKWNGEGDE